jgi:sulfate transport system permease protein
MEIQNDKGFFKWFLIGLCTLFLAVMLVLPLVYVIYTALREGFGAYLAAVTDTYAVKAILLTVKVVLIAVAVNSVFGLFAAWLITKFQFRGKKIISTLIDLPLTISPIIAGLIFVLTFGRQSSLYPYLQNWGIQIIFAVPGIVLATIFVTFPFISREIIPVLTAEGTDEEEAAALLGANGFQIFTQITFPHIKWAFLYGVVLCSARAMGEFGAVSVLSGHLRGITNTMPLYIELLYQAFDFTGAFAISSILVIMAVAILVLRNVLEYRGKKEAEREAGAESAKSRKRKEKVSGQVEALTAGAARL